MVRHGDSNAFHVAPDAPRRFIVRARGKVCTDRREKVMPDNGLLRQRASGRFPPE
jgi:hypothetical protein